MLKPYSAQDVADLLGITLDTFYRTRELRHARDRLPRPLSETGKLRFERSSFDAWATRHHPLRRHVVAANDCAPPIVPDNAQAVSEFVAAHYGRK